MATFVPGRRYRTLAGTKIDHLWTDANSNVRQSAAGIGLFFAQFRWTVPGGYLPCMPHSG